MKKIRKPLSKAHLYFNGKVKQINGKMVTQYHYQSFKKGEGVKLELKSSELLELFNELASLYELYKTSGITVGEQRFVKANKTVQAVAEMKDEELTAVVKGSKSLGAQALARIIRWASDAKNFSLMFDQLEALERDSLVNLNAAVGISTFKRALKEWYDNRENRDEEF